MMRTSAILDLIRGTPIGIAARDNSWLWVTCQCLHLIALCLLYGALLVVDLRVLGVGRNLISIKAVLPFIRIALVAGAISLATGTVFFSGYPESYWPNWAFKLKLSLILFGGLNALLFEFMERRRLSTLAIGDDAGGRAKVIALVSMLTWVVVLMLGRTLPYTGLAF